jgi:gamma-glutamyltranspeptidase/glutathione hydrolase
VIQTRPEVVGSFGMVASTHWLASSAGMSVLERGGNAVDAAVAAGFVLQIVEPESNGPGGDLVGIVWSAADGGPSVVCGQGVSPAAASIDRFDDLGLRLIPGSGLLAATVPGAFGAWTTMLERWGTWELEDALSYAMHYAGSGFPIGAGASATIDALAEFLAEHWQPSASVWLDGEGAPRPGALWRTPGIEATYRRLLDEAVGGTREARISAARRAFYSGFVAEAIDAFSKMRWRDASGDDHAGFLTGDDLARWSASVEPPVSVDFAGRYEVLKSGPWGQGPVFCQQLRLLEETGLLDLEVRSVAWVHAIVEAAKLAFADREAWYGDPVDADVPLAALLSKAYARERAGLLGSSASLDLVPGAPDGRSPVLPAIAQPTFDDLPEGAVGEPTLRRLARERGDTCHLDVVDRWGSMVSVTPSGGWLQSSPVIPSLGFPLGTRAQMFYLQPGLANSLRPGVRPRTTLTPTIALRDGEPWLSLGTPGGDMQDQWQVPFFAEVVRADRFGTVNLQAAIDQPSFHTTHFPSSFYPRDAHPGEVHVEERLAPEVLDDLRARGHDVVVNGPWRLGRLTAIARERDFLHGAATARSVQAYCVGR